MSLLGPLGLRSPEVVAVVGAGGKTTLVYRLAAEARALGRRVLVTTTTHMGTLPEATTGPVFVVADSYADLAELERVRQERPESTQTAAARFNEISRAPIRQELYETLVPDSQ